MLPDPARFGCNRAARTDEERFKLQPLAPLLREFFEQYRRVSAVHGDEDLYRDIKPAIDEHGRESDRFLQIGEIGGHMRLLVRSGEEDIYRWGEPLGLNEPSIENAAPSVYHFLVGSDRLNSALAAVYGS